MRIQSSAAVVAPLALAGAAVSAESNLGAVSSSHVNAAPSATNSDSAPMKRRLLQRIKKRNQLFSNNASSSSSSKHNNVGMPDVGILSGSRTPRFLQDDTDDGTAEFFCPRTTCPQALCDCAEDEGSLERCASQLQDVCLSGKLSDCVFRDYVPVYMSLYCPFTFCLNDGTFQENQCDCAFYDMYCAQIQEDKEKCDLLKDDAGADEKMPFFGCDEDLAAVCDQAKSCKDKGELNGLPIGEWQGMAYRMNGAGGASTGGVVLGALGLVSVFLFVLNV